MIRYQFAFEFEKNIAEYINQEEIGSMFGRDQACVPADPP